MLRLCVMSHCYYSSGIKFIETIGPCSPLFISLLDHFDPSLEQSPQAYNAETRELYNLCPFLQRTQLTDSIVIFLLLGILVPKCTTTYIS